MATIGLHQIQFWLIPQSRGLKLLRLAYSSLRLDNWLNMA